MEAMVNVYGRRLRGKVLKKSAKTVVMKIRGPTAEHIIKRHIIKHQVAFEGYRVWKE